MSLRIRLRTKKRKALRRRRAARKLNLDKYSNPFLSDSAFTSLASQRRDLRTRFDLLKFNLHPAQRKFFEDSSSFRTWYGPR